MRSSLLGQTEFRWFFSGRLVSLLGSSMAPVALAFGVLDSTGSITDLGLVLAARMVPLLAFLLIGGATADRFSRKTVLVCANLGLTLTQGAVAGLVLSGHFSMPAVATLSVVDGVLTAFMTPALRGIVPQLVDKSHLRPANALLGSVRNATKLLGPSLSGILVVVVGSGPALAVDALSYLLAAGCLARLTLPASAPAKRSTPLLADIRAGWTEFRRIRWVWRVTLSFCVINLVQTGTWQVLGPSLTKQLSGEAVWGFVLSAQGAGMLVMSTLLHRLTVRHFLRLGLLMGALGALPFLVLGARADAGWLAGAAFVAGLGGSIAGISWDTSLQEHVPGDVLSRVTSYDDLLSYVAIPVGQLCVGPLAHAFGGFRVAMASGIVYALMALLPLASAAVRQLPHAQPEPAGAVTEDHPTATPSGGTAP